MSAPTTARHTPIRFRESDCDVTEFAKLLDRTTVLADFPHAVDVQQNVLVYDSALLRRAVATDAGREEVEGELVRALTDGPGVVVLKGAFPDLSVVDRVTAVFDRIIADEKASGTAKGDHFAKAGANDRVWNALEKLAVRDPEAFVDYYANDVLALVATAWLGPGYQVTSQVNVVRPGGRAQDPHRDYHLGFLSNPVAARYPAHVHLLSPVLTLQGAVAHSDMPLESGPTLYLPYSHQYPQGYLAWRQAEFKEYFAEHHVQLPLEKGDAGFFNPALFHGAGTNVSSDVQRVANLLQVSSAFGRAMETVDRVKVAKSVYSVLLSRKDSGADEEFLANAVTSAAEGYPFPTNLDRDPNVDGLTPLSESELLHRALAEGWDVERTTTELDAYAARRRTDEI
jgi:ectoine hydroxylase-related dioxygenase (phytanoyl-CoA dioxygenase family)